MIYDDTQAKNNSAHQPPTPRKGSQYHGVAVWRAYGIAAGAQGGGAKQEQNAAQEKWYTQVSGRLLLAA